MPVPFFIGAPMVAGCYAASLGYSAIGLPTMAVLWRKIGQTLALGVSLA